MLVNIAAAIGITIIAGLSVWFGCSGESKEVAIAAVSVLGGAMTGAAMERWRASTDKPEEDK